MKRIAEYIRNHVHDLFSTLTNLAYVVAGVMALESNPILGFMVIGLGVVSAGFHWTRSDTWHKADIVGIYYVFAVLASWWLLGNYGVLLGLAIGGAAHWSHKEYRKYSRLIIVGLGLLALGAFKLHNGWDDVATVFVFFFLAFLFAQVGNYMDPTEKGMMYDVAHGVWHILSAVGIYLML